MRDTFGDIVKCPYFGVNIKRIHARMFHVSTWDRTKCPLYRGYITFLRFHCINRNECAFHSHSTKVYSVNEFSHWTKGSHCVQRGLRGRYSAISSSSLAVAVSRAGLWSLVVMTCVSTSPCQWWERDVTTWAVNWRPRLQWRTCGNPNTANTWLEKR